MRVDLSPAALQPRVLAGLLDGAVLLLLCAAYFLVPVLTLGVVLPMWGVLAAIIGYAVIPLAVYKQTLGMALFRVQLVGKDGHPVGLGDVLFRELLGRGWFPAAFLFNLLFGYVATLLGYARFAMPTGLQALFFLASVLALVVAVLGHLLVLGMKDRRSIADMMSRSWVVPRQPRPLADDPEELAEQRREGRRRTRNVVFAEVVIVAVGLGAPWLLTRKTESTEGRAARLLRQKLESQFKANPESEQLTRDLERALAAAGDLEQARQVRATHEAKLAQAREERLQQQLQELQTRPGDEALFGSVLEALEERQRIDEAEVKYQAFLALHPEPEYRAGHAEWLAQVERLDDSLAAYRQLLKDEPTFEGGHKFLARVLVRSGNLEEAQVEYHRELVLDPEDEDAIGALEELNAELGPLSKARLAALHKELKAPVKK